VKLKTRNQFLKKLSIFETVHGVTIKRVNMEFMYQKLKLKETYVFTFEKFSVFFKLKKLKTYMHSPGYQTAEFAISESQSCCSVAPLR